MARKPNEERNQQQKIACLWQLYEMVYSTKTLLVPGVISVRNFADLVAERMIESTIKEVLLSPHSQPVKVYVYRLTGKGLAELRQHKPECAADYRPNTYADGQLVHDLYVQAYLKAEGLSLDAGSTSIDMTATHRRHTKQIRWQRWRYDATASDDARFVAVEVERNIKKGDKVDIFLSKVRDFLAGSDKKLHTVAIVCTTPQLCDFWRKRIGQKFRLWRWEEGEKDPTSAPEMVQLAHPERVSVVLMQRPQLAAYALPERQRNTAAGRRPRPSGGLVERVKAAACAADDEQLVELLKDVANKAEKRAVERVSQEAHSAAKAAAKKRYLERGRQLRGALADLEAARAAQAAAAAEAKQQQKQIRQLQRKLQEAADLFCALRAASVGSQEYYDAFDDLHLHLLQQ